MTAGTDNTLVRTRGAEVGPAQIDTGAASGQAEPVWDQPDLLAPRDLPDPLVPQGRLDLSDPLAPRDLPDPLVPQGRLDLSDPLAPRDLPDPLVPQGRLDLPDPLAPRDLLDPLAPEGRLGLPDLLALQGLPDLLVRLVLMLAAVPPKISLELANIKRAFARPIARLGRVIEMITVRTAHNLG